MRSTPLRAIGATTALLALVGLTAAPIEEAKADEPITTALITAGGYVVAAWGAAAIGAAGAVGAAYISTQGGDDGGDDGEGETMVPGTDENGNINEEESRSSSGGDDLPVVNEHLNIGGTLPSSSSAFVSQSGTSDTFRSYLNRSIFAEVGPVSGVGMGGRTQFNVHGDVLDSPPTTDRFVNSDKQVWTFQMTSPGALPFMLESLTLETHDFPGSLGYSGIVVRASQDGNTIMTWEASVVQGQMPNYGTLPNLMETVQSKPDRLHIENLLFMIPVSYTPDTGAEVQVEVYFENSGMRT